jgi:uncharacterized protein (TIGR03792 family)
VIVEYLTFEVAPDELEDWLVVEERVWSRFLETVPGFVRKELWMADDDPGRVHAAIWWESREAWQAVSDEQVAAVDAEMGPWLRRPTVREYRVVRTR